ncbi:MAG TPA: DUF1361 domain-containing protein [Acidimicrobiales bacterium]|nr:DUF1361 domain-containing protein [Acidimicrobiales bacterium]
MVYARWLLGEIYGLVQINGFWMTWNLLLAFIPAALAVPLLWRPHARTAAWWVGIGVFALFLPNAPYVLTDLIHLRWDAARAASDGVLVFGVLPIYGSFVLVGMSAYLFCVEGIVREVRSVRPGASRSLIELPVHALCSLGIVLGRIARLNSWDTITEPVGTLESVFATLTWRGAPAAFIVILVAVWASFTVLRTLVRAAADWGSGWANRFGLAGSAPRPAS